MGLIDEALDKSWNFFADKWHYWFSEQFVESVALTAIITLACFGLGYFFQILRPVLGAVMLAVVGYWYGFHKGQGTMER